MRLPILRSSPEDQILYQTERYNEDTFGYDIPIREEGDYILVMKYAEVYFAQSQQKVWHVMNIRRILALSVYLIKLSFVSHCYTIVCALSEGNEGNVFFIHVVCLCSVFLLFTARWCSYTSQGDVTNHVLYCWLVGQQIE